MEEVSILREIICFVEEVMVGGVVCIEGMSVRDCRLERVEDLVL